MFEMMGDVSYACGILIEQHDGNNSRIADWMQCNAIAFESCQYEAVGEVDVGDVEKSRITVCRSWTSVILAIVAPLMRHIEAASQANASNLVSLPLLYRALRESSKNKMSANLPCESEASTKSAPC